MAPVRFSSTRCQPSAACSDCFSCMKAWMAPSFAVGDIAEGAGQNPCGACCLHYMCGGLGDCIHGYTTSQTLRKQHGLEGNACGQGCAHFFCSTCAKTQELRLVKMVRDARKPALIAGALAPGRQMMMAPMAPPMTAAPVPPPPAVQAPVDSKEL